MQLPAVKVALFLLVIMVPVFFFLVPIAYLPYSYHTVCSNFGANCQHVTQYGSLSYVLLCTGAIYETDGSYWIGRCMRF